MIIYDGQEKVIYFYDFELFKVDYRLSTVQKLTFQQFIREIDTCADKNTSWKKKIIVEMAQKVGMLK